MTVIDTQTHWFSPTLLDAYCEAEEYPRCRKDGDRYMYELAPERWFPLTHVFTDVEHQMETLTTAGIDVIVSSSASFGDVNGIDTGRATEVSHALNEERAELQREHKGRFYGLATVPWQDTDAALEVVDRAADLGLPGVLMHSNIAGGPIDADHLRPVYARLAELGLVISLHPARTIMENELRDYGMEYLVGYLFDTSVAALRLVLSGIFEEHPGLKVVHPHCGGTLPYLAGRVDNSHSKPYSLGHELPVLPSEQLSRFWTDTVAQSPDTLGFASNFYEDGHVVFGSDYPLMDPERELSFARDHADGAVLAANAAALFGLDGSELT